MSFENPVALEEVVNYLERNRELRKAVGADPDVELTAHPLGLGEHNLNYWFLEPQSGMRYVLRVNVVSQPFHDNQVAYEFAALQALAPSGCTPLPVFLDDSPDAPGKGVLVESFCEGSELDFDHLGPQDLNSVAKLMANVHAVPVADSCLLHRPADPLRELFDECLQRFEVYRKSAFEDARITRWTERFIAHAERALQEAGKNTGHTCIVNTEPLPSHFLLPGAYIDWERPIVGEPAQDIAYFTAPTTTFWDSNYLMETKEADRFVQDYWRSVKGRFPSGNFEERYRAYRALTALRSTTWCCRVLVHYSQPSAHRTHKTTSKLPVYLSDDFLTFIADECFAD